MKQGIWISTLFAAEEIPSAIVTFVALLMFLQIGASVTLSTTLAALLFLPCILKSFLRAWVRRAGHFRHMLLLIEGLMCITLMALAFAFSQGIWYVFCALMLTSFLVAWHELTSRMYYERMLYPPQQKYYTNLKIASAQLAVILTYGVLIIMVGNLEVFFRQIRHSWAMGCYMTAGIFMLFLLLHLFILRNPQIGDQRRKHSMSESVKAEVHVMDRIRRQPHWWVYVLCMFLMLVPQSLMFFARVHYLFDKAANGGLGCTIQEIGFAQGTVGVIAFTLGLTIGRSLMRWIPVEKLFWPLTLVLGLSPAVYLFMTIEMPNDLIALCVGTFQAQLLFGLGLSICRVPLSMISGERYRNCANLLSVPLVATCMLLPMIASGILISQLGYQKFFLLNTLSAPICWILIWVLHPTCKEQRIPKDATKG
jgi:PAT family beta-lactamase induction signal transducer AmpG